MLLTMFSTMIGVVGFFEIGTVNGVILQEDLKNSGSLQSADELPRAWQSDEKYVPPNFEAFFPDDEAGGLRLDELYRAPDRESRPDEEILKTVRQGLRRTSQHRTLVLSWIGNRYVWNKSPQNPDAIELMYHAADFSGPRADPYGTRHYAVYFGLSVVRPKSSAILRTLVDLCIRIDDPNDIDRVAWGAASQRKELLNLLGPHLKSQDKAVRDKAIVLQRIFKGELKAFVWARSRTQSQTPSGPSKVSYSVAFRDLHSELAKNYPNFSMKKIDWKAVGNELIPLADKVNSHEEFGLLCLKLVARLEDSHAYVRNAAGKLPAMEFPRWDPGFACLIDNRERPVVYYVDKDAPADRAGVRIGMTLVAVDGRPVNNVIAQSMRRWSEYQGWSSRRYLRYQAARWLGRQVEQDREVSFKFERIDGSMVTITAPASLNVRYLPRLPVPIKGIQDAGNVSWTIHEGNIGHIYVRRIRNDLIASLDRAVSDLKDCIGLVIDVRGNSGGGFDASRSHLNFDKNSSAEPDRPRFMGPIAMMIDARCISAGEGWASWFVSNNRARLFGETTAGASSRKKNYTTTNGLFSVRYSVKAYKGYLDRPIERRGLEPHVPIRQSAKDLVAGQDTVLQAARQYLTEASKR